MGRAPCCDKSNVKKGPWSPEEDAKLKDFINKHGTAGNWIALPHKAGLKRCGKSCRLRWLNYLRPNLKHGEFSEDEDKIICNMYASIGSRWSIIASQLPGRTDNDIKNYWNSKLRKKLLSQQKPSFLPSQSPPFSHHHNSESFLNGSSSFHNYNSPNSITNVTIISNNMNYNSIFTGLFSSLPSTSTNSIRMMSNEENYLGFESKNMNKEYYCNDVNQNHGFVDQKQRCLKNLEEEKEVRGINNNSRSSSINVEINRYLMNADDENKTTHMISDGCYYDD